MSRQDGIKIEGAIIEVLNGRLYRVELPNGHRLLAHLPGRRAEQFSPAALAGGKAGPSKREMAVARAPELKIEVGGRENGEMLPFYFSNGHVRLEERKIYLYESSRIGEEVLKKLKNYQAKWRDLCHLHKSPPQTTTRIII